MSVCIDCMHVSIYTYYVFPVYLYILVQECVYMYILLFCQVCVWFFPFQGSHSHPTSAFANECTVYLLVPRVSCIPGRLAYLLPRHVSDFLLREVRGSCRPTAVPQGPLGHGMPCLCWGTQREALLDVTPYVVFRTAGPK